MWCLYVFQPVSRSFSYNMMTDLDRGNWHLQVLLIVIHNPQVLIQYFIRSYREKRAEFDIAHEEPLLLRKKIHLLIYKVKKPQCWKNIAMHAVTKHRVCLVSLAWRITSHSRAWGPGRIGFGTAKTLHEAELTLVFSSHKQPKTTSWCWLGCWPTCGWQASTGQTV